MEELEIRIKRAGSFTNILLEIKLSGKVKKQIWGVETVLDHIYNMENNFNEKVLLARKVTNLVEQHFSTDDKNRAVKLIDSFMQRLKSKRDAA